MNKVIQFAKRIDALSQWVGEKASLLLIPLTCIAIFEVIMRYIFNRPTIWAWDVNIQLGAVLVALVGAHALLSGMFVRVDIVVNRLPRKVGQWLDLIMSIVPLFAAGILAKLAFSQAWKSCLKQECLASTWMPYIYPLRIVVALGFALLLLQVISRIIHSLSLVLGVEAAVLSPREDN